MPKKRHNLSFNWIDVEFHFWRLSDDEYLRLRRHSYPIEEDRQFLFDFWLTIRQSSRYLTLSKAFLSLESLFGQSSKWLDDWKGSFSFPLLLVLTKGKTKYYYLLEIYDQRASLRFAFYKLLEEGAEEKDTAVYRAPDPAEFSQDNFNDLILFIYRYLQREFSKIKSSKITDFFKSVKSEHLLYGYVQENFFEEQYQEPEDYQEALTSLEQRFEATLKKEKALEIQQILQQVIGED